MTPTWSSGQTDTLTATGHLANAHFWSPERPLSLRRLHDAHRQRQSHRCLQDRTGFRKAEFKGGAGTGGVFINDQFVYLKGYAQRSTDDWAGLGQAYPDWMHDFNAALIRSSNANYVRWMHISPQRRR